MNKIGQGRLDNLLFFKRQVQRWKAYQKFTAIGQVEDNDPCQVTINSGFGSWRRKINYYPAKELEIRPLLDDLKSITNRGKWGLHLMSGFVEIDKADFKVIAEKMLTDKKI